MARLWLRSASVVVLAGSHLAGAWDPTPHWEMSPCASGSTGDKECHFHAGSKTVWDPATKKYTAAVGDEGNYGAPFYDTVDTEWDKKWMGKQPSGLQEAIINGYLRIGRDTTEAYGEKGADLTLPLPVNDPKFLDGSDDFTDYLHLVHPDHGYTQTVSYLDQTSGKMEEIDIEFNKALRSGGFPMCPNYWDAFGGDNPGPLNLFTDHQITQDSQLYKFPNKVVGSPLVGDPELHFCRKWQEKYDATCCATYLDDDIQEEYEELTGSGYLGAHVFVQQYLCLPCHPMISCMIDEASQTLRIPLAFAQKMADKIEDFDRTGLKVKIGEDEPDNGPTRQDELYIPSQYFAQQRGSGGGPAPPFPPPNCANNNDAGEGWGIDPAVGSEELGYWPETDCPDTGDVEGCDDDDGCGGEGQPDGTPLMQFEGNAIGHCSCTGPGKDCACIREFLLHLRPPGINGYDGLDLNIEIVDDDDPCGVLYDLMAGSVPDPLLTSGSADAGSRQSSALLAFGLALAGVVGR